MKKDPETGTFTGNGKVLIMDDEEMVRKVTDKMLHRLGYKTGHANDGLEAIELYKKAMDSGQPFDAAIIDLSIPEGMGGKETIKKLLEIDPGINAIVSSGYIHDPILSDYKQYGFCEVIPKPYKIHELSNILNKVLGRKKSL